MRALWLAGTLTAAFAFVGCSSEDATRDGGTEGQGPGSLDNGAGRRDGDVPDGPSGATDSAVAADATSDGRDGASRTVDSSMATDAARDMTDAHADSASEASEAGSSREQNSGQDAGGEDVACQSVRVETDLEVTGSPGNLLVVFDRSGSMSDPWGGVPRYEAAGAALITAITPLQDLLTVGGVLFPSMPSSASTTCEPTNPNHWLPGGACLNAVGPSCEVTAITESDQISFRPAAEFIAELPNQWFLSGAGMTPLEEAVNRADEALASATLGGTIAVVIMTDGEPTCGDLPENVENVVAQWLSDGIQTLVVGLPGSATAADLLTSLAVAGGTDAFIEPDDPAALQDEISSLVTATVQFETNACVINLLQPRSVDAEDLHLVITEQGRQREVPQQLSGGGWSVSADGTTVTLEGHLCDDAQDGRFQAVDLYVGCVRLP